MQVKQVCTKCVMDTSDPYISFNQEGVCSHCEYYDKYQRIDAKSKDELANVVEKIKHNGRNKKYDCIIGVSGGVDSSYAAYLVRDLGLRPLAVHVDNGWNSELAVKNIENLLKQLGVDLYTHVLDWEEFRGLQINFLRASTPDAEIPSDHAIGAVIFRMAAKHQIKYIISGSNLSTEATRVKAWSYGHSDWRYIKSVNKLMGGEKLVNFPHYSFMDAVYFKVILQQTSVKLLDYIDYKKDDAIELLQNKFGWKYYGGKHYESIYTRFFQGYYLTKKFGFDKRKAHFSSQIWAGHMTREEALHDLSQEYYDPVILKEDIDFVKKKLKISDREFNHIMTAKPKRFDEYPSYETHILFRYVKKNFKLLQHRFPFLKRIGF
jgi:N-acetyl sugar amidotransferase